VAFTKTGERLVGQIAKRQAALNPERTVFSIKRFMGRKYSEVTQEIKQVPYKVGAGPNDAVRVDIDASSIRREILRSSCASWQMTPRSISVKRLKKLSSQCLPILTTHSGRH